MSKYIDAEKLIAEIKGIIAAVQTTNHPDALGTMEQCMAAAEIETLNLILDATKGLQQEQPTPYDEAYLNEKIAKATKSWEGVDVDKFMDEVRGREPEVDLAEEITRFFSKNPIPHEHITNWPLLKNTAIHFYGLRNRALEEAARHVYESWMGGTMDDVRRDMVELGKVLNARKEN